MKAGESHRENWEDKDSQVSACSPTAQITPQAPWKEISVPGSQYCALLLSYQMPAPLKAERSGPKVTTVIGALTN